MITCPTSVWRYLNEAKVMAVQMGFDEEQCLCLKAECDDLFRQVTGLSICPAWWIGGFSRR